MPGYTIEIYGHQTDPRDGEGPVFSTTIVADDLPSALAEISRDAAKYEGEESTAILIRKHGAVEMDASGTLWGKPEDIQRFTEPTQDCPFCARGIPHSHKGKRR